MCEGRKQEVRVSSFFSCHTRRWQHRRRSFIANSIHRVLAMIFSIENVQTYRLQKEKSDAKPLIRWTIAATGDFYRIERCVFVCHKIEQLFLLVQLGVLGTPNIFRWLCLFWAFFGSVFVAQKMNLGKKHGFRRFI